MLTRPRTSDAAIERLVKLAEQIVLGDPMAIDAMSLCARGATVRSDLVCFLD